MGDGEVWLTMDDWAARMGLSPKNGRRTVAGWITKGRPRQNPIPPPDKVVQDRGHVRPMWRESTYEAWAARRPGHGGRPRTSEPDSTGL